MRIQINWRSLSNDLSRFLLIPAGMALCSLPIALLSQEFFVVLPLTITCAIAAALSLILNHLGQTAKESPLYQILITVALGWALIAIMGALPLWLTALRLTDEATPTIEYFRNGLNALFEGFSGFTSAGLTMAVQPSQLPHTLQWWRSFMQWVGGVGVIVLALAVIEPTQSQYRLYQAEGRQTRLRLTMTRTVRRIWKIYIGFTIASMVLFRVCGMPWWEAINHGLTAIATGGFSITDGSMSSYSPLIKLAIMVVMVMGAISFSLHDRLLTTRRLNALLHNRQHFLLIVLLVIGTVIVTVDYFTFTQQWAVVDGAFQWFSALTTCGFSTQSIFFWSSSNKIILSLGMIVGGAAGSTVGGLKLNRVLALCEAIAWRFRRPTIKSHQVVMRFINRQPLTPSQASRQIESATALTLLWLATIVVSILILMRFVPAEYGLSDVLFEVSSALGAAGLSVGITGPSLHWAGKTILILLMWMGRLEIFPVLLMFVLPLNQLLTSRK